MIEKFRRYVIDIMDKMEDKTCKALLFAHFQQALDIVKVPKIHHIFDSAILTDKELTGLFLSSERSQMFQTKKEMSAFGDAICKLYFKYKSQDQVIGKKKFKLKRNQRVITDEIADAIVQVQANMDAKPQNDNGLGDALRKLKDN